MPVEGFLTPYEETTKVDLERGYFAEMKQYLTSVETGRTQAVLAKQSVKAVNGEPVFELTEMDQQAFRREIVANALKSWNLTDANNSPLPVGNLAMNRRSVDLLPDWVVNELAAVVKTSPRDGEESKSVEDGSASSVSGEGSAPTGDGGSEPD